MELGAAGRGARGSRGGPGGGGGGGGGGAETPLPADLRPTGISVLPSDQEVVGAAAGGRWPGLRISQHMNGPC